MELERVLSYDRVRAMVNLNDEEIAEYLGYLRAEAASEIVFPGPAPGVVPAVLPVVQPRASPLRHRLADAGQASRTTPWPSRG
jgi:hypothetical protein